jgi:hypothetical protein
MSDEKNENGLIISNKKITSISGPVSFYYLRPTKQVYEDGNKEYFPLVILFGDYHRSFENNCNPCNCGYEYKGINSAACCYRLDDNLFINKINNLASKYTVDFYTETFFGGSGLGFQGGMMKEFTTGKFLNCYNKKLKHLCFIGNNIRWQAGDIRIGGVDFEDLVNPKSYNRYDIKNIVSEKYIKNSYIEYQMSYLLNLLTYGYFNKFNNIIKKTYFVDAIYFRNFLMSIFEEEKFNIEKFAKILFSILNKDNSGIYKQVKKQTFRNFNDLKEWEDIYCRSLKNVAYNIVKIKDDMIKQMKVYVYNIPRFVSKEISIDENFKILMNIFMIIVTSSFLDIYVISRMLKQPEDGKRSEISFCYFGNSHVINIVNLLLSTGAYEVIASKDVNGSNRCIDLSDIYVNLDEDLKK